MLPLCLGLTSALLIGTSFGQTYHISLISTKILHDEYLGSDALDFHTKAHTYTTAKFITVQHDLSNPGIKPRSPPLCPVADQVTVSDSSKVLPLGACVGRGDR